MIVKQDYQSKGTAAKKCDEAVGIGGVIILFN